MTISTDRSKEIAGLLIRPDSNRPEISLVSWKKSNRNSLDLRFGALNQYPEVSAVIVSYLTDIFSAQEPPLDFAVYTAPYGRRFGRPAAALLNLQTLAYDTKVKTFTEPIPSDVTRGAYVDDYIIGTGRAVSVIQELQREGIRMPLCASIVSAENPQAMQQLREIGVQFVSLTTTDEIIRHPYFPKNHVNTNRLNWLNRRASQR